MLTWKEVIDFSLKGNPTPDRRSKEGTPWFLFKDKHDNVVFSDFHLNPDTAIEFLKTL
jgi:hypothetical protein